MKENVLQPFLSLASLFHNNGFKLYLVGGSARDFLLGRAFADFDCATEATPQELSIFLPNANYTFQQFGTVMLKHAGHKFEITTLREEGKYVDFRHPTYIHFVQSITEDYKRRDFTVNALYINDKLEVFDFCGGQKHLQERTLHMIGDANERFNEDPLRIIRALRFAVSLNFSLAPALQDAIIQNAMLITHLNKQKVQAEIRKLTNEEKVVFQQLVEQLNLQVFL